MSVFCNIIVTALLMPWGGIVIMSPMMIASEGFKDSKSSIVSAVVMICYPTGIFAFLKLFGFSFYGMEPDNWLIGFSLISTLIIAGYGIPGMLLNLSKGISNIHYCITGTSVYFDGQKIKGADAVTFKVLEYDKQYAKDINNVFLNGKIISDVDPCTFKPVETISDSLFSISSAIYWKDNYSVFYNGRKVENANPHCFQIVNNQYAKDNLHVYYKNSVLEGANPLEFKAISANIGVDENFVFVFNKKTSFKIDIPSFSVVSESSEAYCKDKNSVFVILYKGLEPLVQLEDADPLSFSVLDSYYAKDKSNIYYSGFDGNNNQVAFKIPGVRLQTFSVRYDEATGSDATDGINSYLRGKRLKE